MVPGTFGMGGRFNRRTMPHDKGAKKKAKEKTDLAKAKGLKRPINTFEGVVADYLERHASLYKNPVHLFRMIATFNKITFEHPRMPMFTVKHIMIEKHPHVVASDVNELVDKLNWAKRLPGGSLREREAFLKKEGRRLAKELSKTRGSATPVKKIVISGQSKSNPLKRVIELRW
jgi:hypothetical protein